MLTSVSPAKLKDKLLKSLIEIAKLCFFFYFPSFFLKLSISVTFCVEENMKREIICLQDATKEGTLFVTFKRQILRLLGVQPT